MKIPIPNLSLDQQLAEFDYWLTPEIERIQDTEKYQVEVQSVELILAEMAMPTNEFDDPSHCTPSTITSTILDLMKNEFDLKSTHSENVERLSRLIDSLFSLLFVVTGKSDNNIKCQFPVFIRLGRQQFPHIPWLAKGPKVTVKNLGRTIKSKKVTKLAADAFVYSSAIEDLYLNDVSWLLSSYIDLLLHDTNSINQFWSFGRGYFYLLKEKPGSQRDLLAPLVTFKVRGSVAASGGHIPEDRLREQMTSWGLINGVDFNFSDVDVNPSGSTSKTRSYDFALPYQTQNWRHKLFIQCQFYAGDSGSVSHKVVDQTTSSRTSTNKNYPDAKFIEYLDGAGYYSSLNTDLSHMLKMGTTHSFFQLRTAAIRLRRELQAIGFLTQVELIHATLRTRNLDMDDVRKMLDDEGYSSTEIDRCIAESLEDRTLIISDNCLQFSNTAIGNAVKFALLDVIANVGTSYENIHGLRSVVLIPGYGAYFGAKLNDLSTNLKKHFPSLNIDIDDFTTNLQWLSEHEHIVLT